MCLYVLFCAEQWTAIEGGDQGVKSMCRGPADPATLDINSEDTDKLAGSVIGLTNFYSSRCA